MNFLVDANLSPRVAELLRAADHDALAVREVGLQTASDDAILDHALQHDQVIISNDTDFGTLLAYHHLIKPSFILIRSSDPLTPDQQAPSSSPTCPQSPRNSGAARSLPSPGTASESDDYP